MSASALREQLKARQLLPHQVEFVETALESMPGGRILLADDVGLGKTHACGALAWALGQKLDREPRMLVLAPTMLLAQWKSRLEETASGDVLIVDAAAYRRLEAHTAADENPWRSVNTVVASIDFAKREDRLAPLVEAPWDLVIFDESHRATSRSQRGRVLRALWKSDLVGLMVAESATPHSGDAEDFELFTGPTTRILRRRARELRDWDGNSLIPNSAEQVVEVVALDLSPEERELYEAVAQLAAGLSTDDRPRKFLRQTLIRRAASSLFALEQTIRRALAKANFATHGGGTQASLFDDEPSAYEQAELFEEVGMFEPVAHPMDRDELRALLDRIDRVEVDTKWRACANVLEPEIVGSNGSALIFCDFADTAEYLAGLLGSFECPVGVVTSSIADAERQRIYETFRSDGGALVVTSAASEGLSLPFVKLCIHYDIPWNASQVAQRIGRVHRYGATPGAVRHAAFSDEILMPKAVVQKLLLLTGPDFRFDRLNDLDLSFPGNGSTNGKKGE